MSVFLDPSSTNLPHSSQSGQVGNQDDHSQQEQKLVFSPGGCGEPEGRDKPCVGIQLFVNISGVPGIVLGSDAAAEMRCAKELSSWSWETKTLTLRTYTRWHSDERGEGS